MQVYFATPADTMEYIKAGRLRALAVTGCFITRLQIRRWSEHPATLVHAVRRLLRNSVDPQTPSV
jgi:hypothetical protein